MTESVCVWEKERYKIGMRERANNNIKRERKRERESCTTLLLSPSVYRGLTVRTWK